MANPGSEQQRQAEGGSQKPVGEHQRAGQITGYPGKEPGAPSVHDRVPPAPDAPSGPRQSDEEVNEASDSRQEMFEDDEEIQRLKNKSRNH